MYITYPSDQHQRRVTLHPKMRAHSPAPLSQMKTTSKMSSIVTWDPVASRMSKTLSNGGLTIGVSIPVSGEWPEITSLSLVCILSSRSLLTIWAHTLIALSVAVEHVFSQGCLLLSHVRNRLSAQSTRTLLCLGYWSKLGYINNSDLLAVASLPDAEDVGMGSDEE